MGSGPRGRLREMRMPTSRRREVLDQVRRAALGGGGAGLTDGHLLELYTSRRDDAAFTALVRRHGPMVMGVCLRALRHRQDAEDAFQATFLVLARKAVSIGNPALLANWLYGVAYNAARKARAVAARRRARERQVAVVPEPVAPGPAPCDGLAQLLDEELRRLPEKYRVAVVLCDLEGLSHKEAARRLRCLQGTLSGRLSRARSMLAKRLARHGLLPAGAASVFWSEGWASASVPGALVASTVEAATLGAPRLAVATGLISAKTAALTEGVLRTMFLTKLKTVTGLVAIGLLTAATALPYTGLAGEPRGPRSPADPPAGFGTNPQELAQAKEEYERAKKSLAQARIRLAQAELEKTLLELDRRWWKGDPATLAELAADDLITVSAVGRYDKAALLEASKSRRAVDGHRRDVEVSRVSPDVAVVTYVYDCTIVLTDGSLFQNCRDRRLSMVWAKRQDRWVAVFSQETVLPGGE
jgi:RNA polymerase sigma factor (sigma-70 family)